MMNHSVAKYTIVGFTILEIERRGVKLVALWNGKLLSIKYDSQRIYPLYMTAKFENNPGENLRENIVHLSNL